MFRRESRALRVSRMLVQANKPGQRSKRLTRRSGSFAGAGRGDTQYGPIFWPLQATKRRRNNDAIQPSTFQRFPRRRHERGERRPDVVGVLPGIRSAPAEGAFFDSSPPPAGSRGSPSRLRRPTTTLRAIRRSLATSGDGDPPSDGARRGAAGGPARGGGRDRALDGVLAYLPVAEAVLVQLELDVSGMNEPDRPSLAELVELRRLLKVFKKQRSKLNAAQTREWTELCRSLAVRIRLPDSDRIWMGTPTRLPARLLTSILLESGGALAGVASTPALPEVRGSSEGHRRHSARGEEPIREGEPSGSW